MQTNMKRVAWAAALLGVVLLSGLIPLRAQEAAAIQVSVKDHSFEPAEIKAPAGKPFTLRVKNLDPTPMEFESKAADDWSLFVKYCRSVQLHQSDRSSRRRILLAMYRRMKKHIRQQSPLTGRLRCWWLKQRLQYSTRLVA